MVLKLFPWFVSQSSASPLVVRGETTISGLPDKPCWAKLKTNKNGLAPGSQLLLCWTVLMILEMAKAVGGCPPVGGLVWWFGGQGGGSHLPSQNVKCPKPPIQDDLKSFGGPSKQTKNGGMPNFEVGTYQIHGGHPNAYPTWQSRMVSVEPLRKQDLVRVGEPECPQVEMRFKQVSVCRNWDFDPPDCTPLDVGSAKGGRGGGFFCWFV